MNPNFAKSRLKGKGAVSYIDKWNVDSYLTYKKINIIRCKQCLICILCMFNMLKIHVCYMRCCLFRQRQYLQKSCLREEKDLHQKNATRIESQGEWRGGGGDKLHA